MDQIFLKEKYISLSPALADCSLAVVRLDLLRLELTRLGEDRSIDLMLTPEEQQVLRRFSLAKRRMEWLGGRLAAKSALHRLHPHNPDAAPDWQADPILPDPTGRPMVLGRNANAGLSISHSGAIATALARMDGPCGIDVQHLTPTIIGIRHRFSSPEERRLLAEHPLSADLSRETRLTILWTIKEACRKIPSAKIPGFLEIMITGPLYEDGPLLVCGGSFTAGATPPLSFTATSWQDHESIFSCVVPGIPDPGQTHP